MIIHDCWRTVSCDSGGCVERSKAFETCLTATDSAATATPLAGPKLSPAMAWPWLRFVGFCRLILSFEFIWLDFILIWQNLTESDTQLSASLEPQLIPLWFRRGRSTFPGARKLWQRWVPERRCCSLKSWNPDRCALSKDEPTTSGFRTHHGNL